jgi:hypothetical protein
MIIDLLKGESEPDKIKLLNENSFIRTVGSLTIILNNWF